MPDRRSCSEVVARFLADRPHFRRQLVEKLRKRDYSGEEIEQTLDRFVELGLLDEVQAVRSYVEEKRRRQLWGLTRLRAELGRRGAESAAIDTVLRDFDGDADEVLARKELELWRRRGRGSVDGLARRLARKGFESRVIVRLLSEVRDQESQD